MLIVKGLEISGLFAVQHFRLPWNAPTNLNFHPDDHQKNTTCIVLGLNKKTKTMKTKAMCMSDLHFEHEMWSKELAFCDDEIKLLTNRLEEVTAKNTDRDMLREVEHFQNQFIVQKQNIDIFKHDINGKEHELAQFAKDHPVAVDHVHFEDHDGMRDTMESFAKNYNDIKQEFRRFVGKWM